MTKIHPNKLFQTHAETRYLKHPSAIKKYDKNSCRKTTSFVNNTNSFKFFWKRLIFTTTTPNQKLWGFLAEY